MTQTTLHDHIVLLSEKHGGMRPAAKALNIDVGYLSRLASGRKANPSKKTLEKLGLVQMVSYRSKE